MSREERGSGRRPPGRVTAQGAASSNLTRGVTHQGKTSLEASTYRTKTEGILLNFAALGLDAFSGTQSESRRPQDTRQEQEAEIPTLDQWGWRCNNKERSGQGLVLS